jgi:hypothetical protein
MGKNLEKSLFPGKAVMVRCELVNLGHTNCHVDIRMPTGDIVHVHLNDLLPPDDSYVGWEDPEEYKDEV